jgi:hypothetical protein
MRVNPLQYGGDLTFLSNILMDFRSLIITLIHSYSFGHNLCLKSQIEECDFILHIYSSRPFQRLVNSLGPNLVPNIWDTMGLNNSQMWWRGEQDDK